MGSNGSNEIREHAWFDNFPWDKLSTFEIKPPYVPNV